MFKLVKNHTFKWPVKVSVPGQKGEHQKHEFLGEFRKCERTAFLEASASPDVQVYDDFMFEHFIGWDERVQDENGVTLPVTDENRRALLVDIYARPAISAAYLEGISGAKRKN